MVHMIKMKLRELIKQKGYESWSYRKLAKAIGISHLPVWKLLNGEPYNPSFEMLNKLCRFFGCQPGDLMEYKKDQK